MVGNNNSLQTQRVWDCHCKRTAVPLNWSKGAGQSTSHGHINKKCIEIQKHKQNHKARINQKYSWWSMSNGVTHKNKIPVRPICKVIWSSVLHYQVANWKYLYFVWI